LNKLHNGIAVFVAFLGIWQAPSASAANVFDDIQNKLKAQDNDYLTRNSSLQSLQANCDISGALSAALAGDDKAFRASLDQSEKNLRTVSATLPAIAARGKFPRQIRISASDSATPGLNSIVKTASGDQILAEIARIAGESADIIEKIKSNEGSSQDLSRLFSNNAMIMQLILAFYTGAKA
jgi:hypothetical protein